MMTETRPNIAVVVLDTLRIDSFRDHFQFLPGTEFTNAWSTSHATVPAHGSLFTGLYPSEAGMTINSPVLDTELPVLPELLRRGGYRTRAFSCNTNITPVFNFSRGLDSFTGPDHVVGVDEQMFNWKRFIEETNGDGPARFLRALYRCVADDVDTLSSLRMGAELKLRDAGWIDDAPDKGGSDAVEWVRSTSFDDDGEFLFLNLMEAHGPYAPPKAYQTVEPVGTKGAETALEGWPDRDQDDIRTAYEDGVRYLADIYDQLHDFLREDFDIVLTLSDHGESFGEHGFYQHLVGVFPELAQIPISVYAPGTSITDTDCPVSILDVYQTVLAQAGIEPPEDTRGRSLLSPSDRGQQPDPRLTAYHGLSDRQPEKLQRLGVGDDVIKTLTKPCYGVATADGYAFEPPGGEMIVNQDRVDSPGEKIEAVRSTFQDVSGDSRLEVPPDVKQQLADLGYA